MFAWTAAIVRIVTDEIQLNMRHADIAIYGHYCAHSEGIGMPFCISADF